MYRANSANIGPHSIRPVDRLFGLVELMSRHAALRVDGVESARVTNAIVGHLRALSDAMPDAPQVTSDATLWLEHWETIAERQKTMRAQRERHSILELLMNYSEVRR
jgi:prophage DNA circulation protein